MPKLGESVVEGILVRWLKQPGDRVELDEPLVEVDSDKVSTDIPSPVAGTIVELRAQEGETIPVGNVICVIETEEGNGSVSASTEEKRIEAVKTTETAETTSASDLDARDELTCSSYD